jgi:MoaA/NifB/PqqE/SkfB family radical SAM enzyme
MILGRLFSRSLPLLDWIQVEVTTRCNASCTYCPRTIYRGQWPDEHMPMSTFQRLAPAFSKVGHVHLQGWGEPLLHPDFFSMASAAKAAGCRVGTTTNGTLMGREAIQKILEQGLDTVAFSLCDADGRGDAVRKGAPWATVLDAVSRLHRARERRGSAKPDIHVAYMLFRSGWKTLDDLLSRVRGHGVSHVVISTLDFPLTPELEGEAILPRTQEEFHTVRSRLDALVRKGEDMGLGVHYHLSFPDLRRPVCTENVQRALVAAWDGEICPCVYTDLSLSVASYFREGRAQEYSRLSFGNVKEVPLAQIWNGREYRAFRGSFHKGPLWAPCRQCPKLFGT